MLMHFLVDAIWYGKLRYWGFLLYPLAILYQLASGIRRLYLTYNQQKYSVPIIVVGNITAGGVGKTPLVIELVKQLQLKGLRVGIVSRGYGAKISVYPYQIQIHDKANQVGDEPLLLAQRTQCPVVIDPCRTQAVDYLINTYQPQVIVSDDGLQHYRMGRSIEIVVVDGTRNLGNGLCLPAGPLRESERRLQEVDFVVVNQGLRSGAYGMSLVPGAITQIKTGNPLAQVKTDSFWQAIAAIGNPQRFYSTLDTLGLNYQYRSFADHYQFKATDFDSYSDSIIMTEKDAVKCREFCSDTMYYLPVNAVLEDAFWRALWSHQQLKGYC